MNHCESPVKQSQVHEYADKLCELLNIAIEQQELLTNRLSPVMRDGEPYNENQKSTEETLVPLAERLRNFCKKTENLIQRIQSTSNRLEI